MNKEVSLQPVEKNHTVNLEDIESTVQKMMNTARFGESYDFEFVVQKIEKMKQETWENRDLVKFSEYTHLYYSLYIELSQQIQSENNFDSAYSFYLDELKRAHPSNIPFPVIIELIKTYGFQSEKYSYIEGELNAELNYCISGMGLYGFDDDTVQRFAERFMQTFLKDIDQSLASSLMLDTLRHQWIISSNYKNKFITPLVNKIFELFPEQISNYIYQLRAEDLKQSMQGSEDDRYINEERSILPFEISKGKYAMFTKTGIKFIPTEKLSEMEELLQKYSDAYDSAYLDFQYAVRQQRIVYDDLIGLATESLDSEVNSISNFSESELYEYEFISDRAIRSRIEEEFDIKINELTIQEQLFFIRYLKQVTVEESEPVQTFTTKYGTQGMRTFLSLEKGDKSLGDSIVEFGQHEDVARHVFSYYSELLDGADNAEQLVRGFPQAEGAVSELVEQVRANILNRAQKDLVQAVQSDNIENIRGKLDTYNVKAKEYVALLQEVGEGKNICAHYSVQITERSIGIKKTRRFEQQLQIHWNSTWTTLTPHFAFCMMVQKLSASIALTRCRMLTQKER